MTDRPAELSTADLAGKQSRPDDPADREGRRPVGEDSRPPGQDERLARDDELGYVDHDDADRDPLGDGTVARDPGPDLPDHRETAPPGQGAAGVAAGPLLASQDAEGFRARWTDVQTAFVDSPRESVEQADALVAEVMQHLAATFADERSTLEKQWDRGDDIATDELRTAFQRYRSFFERLLST